MSAPTYGESLLALSRLLAKLLATHPPAFACAEIRTAQSLCRKLRAIGAHTPESAELFHKLGHYIRSLTQKTFD